MQEMSSLWTHTLSNAKEPHCVKFNGNYLTIHGDKPKNVQPKCIRCGEGHPASFKGCTTAKKGKKPILSNPPSRINLQEPSIENSGGFASNGELYPTTFN